MPSFQVVFKAGYEVVAWNKEKAVEKATKEILEEIAESGVRKFAVDVELLEK